MIYYHVFLDEYFITEPAFKLVSNFNMLFILQFSIMKLFTTLATYQLFLRVLTSDMRSQGGFISEGQITVITIFSVLYFNMVKKIINLIYDGTALSADCGNGIFFVMKVHTMVLQSFFSYKMKVTFITIKWMGNFYMLMKFFLGELNLAFVTMCFIFMLFFGMFLQSIGSDEL